MSAPDLTEYLDDLLEKIEAPGAGPKTCGIFVSPGTPAYDALGLALAVSKLIDFGGGILKLPSGHKFKLIRPCEACEVAAPMITPGAITSKFCARCANDLAGRYQGLQ